MENNYELMVIFSPEIGEENVKKELQEIYEYISSHGGKVTFEDVHGLREMAHRIKGHGEGFYVVLNFVAPSKSLAELQRNLTISPVVLRFLTLTLAQDYKTRTLKEYDEDAEKAEKDKKTAKEEKKPGARRAAKPAPRKMNEKPAPKAKQEKTEKPEKEQKPTAPKTKKEEPREEKASLEEVDQKLRSIIDDPDITL